MDFLETAVRRAKITPFPVRGSVELERVQKLEARLRALERQVAELADRPVGLVPPTPPPSVSAPVPQPRPPRPKIEDIQRTVCRHYRVTFEELVGPGHFKIPTQARMVAVYLCCRLTVNTAAGIARLFGDRDHSTILSARNRIAKQLDNGNAKLAADIEQIEKALAT